MPRTVWPVTRKAHRRPSATVESKDQSREGVDAITHHLKSDLRQRERASVATESEERPDDLVYQRAVDDWPPANG